jgi:hypothetical protein
LSEKTIPSPRPSRHSRSHEGEDRELQEGATRPASEGASQGEQPAPAPPARSRSPFPTSRTARCKQPDAPGSCTCLTKSEGKTALFNGAENKGKKEPALFSGAKKGAEPAKKDEKSPSLFNGADKSGKKQPSLFERAKGGEDVFKEEPNMSLFSGSDKNKGDKQPGLFDGAHKGAAPLDKEDYEERLQGALETREGRRA